LNIFSTLSFLKKFIRYITNLLCKHERDKLLKKKIEENGTHTFDDTVFKPHDAVRMCG